ncbi:FecR domain-containing protein [Massilia sp. IC2-476]|uniref:FecR family protein n=1 Tax=Massilia sp. IC2-476 TaxID=2887199 RepID=UPI001D102798|nr:FecR family protein [Massilia sp. IC2-476]MCC2971137.1 FecR family protein [Massilia sp. IC2-476]
MLRPLLIISSLAFAAAAHAAEAGKVIFAAGQAQVADKAGAEGTSVQEGELLMTGKDGFLYVKTVDNGLFILRPNTKARIVAYHIDQKNPANNRIKLELISGVARSKSGDAVKQARQNFRFNTPVAAIGVRGTDFTVYTDQETSRVTVLTGGVVVSGFAGGCNPDGVGPCEGAASRELFAGQRGQLLQVKRGDTAPQLLQSSSTGPDQVSPPRADEPVAKSGSTGGSSASGPVLDARKSNDFDKLVKGPSQPTQPPPSKDPVITPPLDPVVVGPEPDPIKPPPVVVEPPPPPKQLVWGRWQSFAGAEITLDLEKQLNSENKKVALRRNYALFQTPGAEYVVPERGSVGFNLQASEAYVYTADGALPSEAKISNGKLNVDFGARTFTTGFDLTTASGELFKMNSEGAVGYNGRLTGNELWKAPTNMNVEGQLSNENGGAAAYIFDRRLDDQRIINGATYWGAQK